MTAFIGANVTNPISGTTEGRSFSLGDRYVQFDGNEYVFVQAAAAIAAGDVVRVTVAYAAQGATTANTTRGQIAGVAPAAFQSSELGWVQVKGIASAINVLASCAAGVRINTTTTAGSLDDDGGVGSKQVQGIYLSTARSASAGPAPGILNYPFIDVTL